MNLVDINPRIKPMIRDIFISSRVSLTVNSDLSPNLDIFISLSYDQINWTLVELIIKKEV